MKTKLNLSLLLHVSKQIYSGKAVWSLLTLNEYTDNQDDPLVNCLRKKAALRIKGDRRYKVIEELALEIFSGKKLSSFNIESQEKIRNFHEESKVRLFKAKPLVLKNHRERKYLREKGFASIKSSGRFDLKTQKLMKFS